MLVAGVEWRRREGALAPLEGLLLASIAPDGGRAAAADDKNHFLEHVLLRFKRLSRRNLTDIAIVDAFGSFQIEIHAPTSHAATDEALVGEYPRYGTPELPEFPLFPKIIGRSSSRPVRWPLPLDLVRS